MRASIIIVGSALALTACGDGADQPKSPEEVMAAADNLVKPTPGLYRSNTEIVDFEIPGIPPAQAAQMRDLAAGLQGEEQTRCLTQAEADEGFKPVVRRLGEGAEGITCAFDRFDADGSDLDAALTCTGSDGTEAHMTIDGVVEAESSSMRMEMSQSSPAIPGGEMRMTMKVSSQRIGDCPERGQ
ncbi:DUF3617 domain-containing protein [Pelagerythrobacter sp.]|uniref:DUF3617 domain-containing protein n=1 Tax=Pelagerythrobacter sp. TaxID=2800702 RepID=UPI0035ADB39D